MRNTDYHVREWTPGLKQLADELIAAVHQIAPELEVLFMGAAALGLPGKNDIDLDILCPQSRLKHYASILTSVFGAPQKLKETMAVWSYMQEGIEIDCILSDPTIPGSHVPAQRKMYETLKADIDLRERYRQLKYECDGLPYEQYEAKKKQFFQQVEAHD